VLHVCAEADAFHGEIPGAKPAEALSAEAYAMPPA